MRKRTVLVSSLLQLIAATAFAAVTANLHLTKPTMGASNWGTSINNNMDTIDDAWKTMSDNISDVDSQIVDSPEVYFLTDTFNGPTGTIVSLPKSVSAITEYGAAANPTSRAGAIGDVYLEKGTSSVTVKCAEANTTDTFSLVVWYKGELNKYGTTQFREWIGSPDNAITDHGDATDDGSLAWVLSEATGTSADVYLPGNHVYPILQNVTVQSGINYKPAAGAVIKNWLSVAGGGSAWTVVSGSIYQMTLANEPAVLRESGVALTKVANVGSIDAAGKWCWNAGQLMVRTTGSVDPDTLGADVLKARYSLTFAAGSHLEDNGTQLFDAEAGEVVFPSNFTSTPQMFGAAPGATSTKAVWQAAASALSSGGKLKVSGGVFTVQIADGAAANGINLLSNTHVEITRDSEVKLELTGASTGAHSIFYIGGGKTNVRIDGGGKITGVRTGPASGESGHSIYILSATNVTIDDITLEDAWGDCIYVSGVSAANVHIKNTTIDAARRNGISVVSCTGIKIKDCTIRNISGAAPQSGIDIEPNASGSVTGIEITGNTIHDCAATAIILSAIAADAVISNGIIDINTIYNCVEASNLFIYVQGPATITATNYIDDVKVTKNTVIGGGIMMRSMSNGFVSENHVTTIWTYLSLDVDVVNNIVKDSTGYGIYLAMMGGSCIGNIIEDTANSGIYMTRSANWVHDPMVVSNNKLRNIGIGQDNTKGYGIKVEYQHNSVVNGNQITKCNLHGIYLIYSTGVEVINNSIVAAGQETTNTYDGIYLASYAHKSNIQGNTIRDSEYRENGTASAGAASTITLDINRTSHDAYAYIGSQITLTAGTGSGQTRTISGYSTGSHTATVSVPWDVVPDNTSVYLISDSIVTRYGVTVSATCSRNTVMHNDLQDVGTGLSLSGTEILQSTANRLSSAVPNGSVTLTPGSTTTVVSNIYVQAASRIFLTPMTANAAADVTGIYISNRSGGVSFTITHPNDADVDKTFSYWIVN